MENREVCEERISRFEFARGFHRALKDCLNYLEGKPTSGPILPAREFLAEWVKIADEMKAEDLKNGRKQRALS